MGRLNEVFERVVIPQKQEVITPEVTMPLHKIKATVGKGYQYPVSGRLVGLDMHTRGDRVKLKTIAGF